MSFISKQPNGLYCRFSTIVDAPTHENMTVDDYAEVIKIRKGIDFKQAKEEAEEVIQFHLQPFERVIEDFTTSNINEEDFKKWLKSVGHK